MFLSCLFLKIGCRRRANLIGTGNFEAISTRVHASVEMHDGGLSLCDRDACLPVVVGHCGATVPQYTFGRSVGNGFAAVWMLEFMRGCCCDRSVGWWSVSGELVALCDACVTCGWWCESTTVLDFLEQGG